MSAILAYIITYDRLPALDSQGRPEMFYGKTRTTSATAGPTSTPVNSMESLG